MSGYQAVVPSVRRSSVTHSQQGGGEATSPESRDCRVDLVGLLSITALLALVASVRSLIPGVNEPHYLSKSRHFWQPEWCGRDLFLSSANAHWFYYATIGTLGAILPLPAAALAGRLLGWLTLAAGWSALGSSLGMRRAAVLAAAALYCALGSIGSLSGEWIVGGVESKVFAYGLLFAGIAAATRAQPRLCAAWMGLSTSFHPLVGGWGCIALAPALAARLVFPRSSFSGFINEKANGTHGVSAVRTIPWTASALIFIGGALPGLVPAVVMLLRAPADLAQRATEIQVFERLDHHLLPERFTAGNVGYFCTLLAIWVGCVFAARSRAQWGVWRSVVLTSVLVAGAALLINLAPWRAAFLKFYPFRLADGLLPCAVALEAAVAAAAVGRWLEASAIPAQRRWRRAPCGALASVSLAVALVWPALDRIQPRWRPENRQAWIGVCQKIAEDTPTTALFLTPRYSFGFKWWAQRAEYATWKDCPQDAASLVEWKSRLDRIQAWRERHFEAGFTREAVFQLSLETGIDFIVAWNTDPYRFEPDFGNSVFSVYRTRPAPDD